MKKKIALLMACVMAFGVAVGGTLAWLTDSTGEVKNTFTESNIDIDLTEEVDTDKDGKESFKMVPGHTITKDPKVTVADNSEDCWLFVKVTESTNPDLDAYISYEIADQYDATTNPRGWQVVQAEDANGVTIIGRKVYKTDATKEFGVIGYTDTKGTAETTGDVFVPNKVLVKDSVDKTMMEAIKTTQPTLTFAAAAVQLYQSNGVEFPVADAYAKVTWPAANP